MIQTEVDAVCGLQAEVDKTCMCCGTTKTAQWRTGPLGEIQRGVFFQCMCEGKFILKLWFNFQAGRRFVMPVESDSAEQGMGRERSAQEGGKG